MYRTSVSILCYLYLPSLFTLYNVLKILFCTQFDILCIQLILPPPRYYIPLSLFPPSLRKIKTVKPLCYNIFPAFPLFHFNVTTFSLFLFYLLYFIFYYIFLVFRSNTLVLYFVFGSVYSKNVIFPFFEQCLSGLVSDM